MEAIGGRKAHAGGGIYVEGGVVWEKRAQIIKRARVIKGCLWIIEIYQKRVLIERMRLKSNRIRGFYR